jgi:hypothetical protein
VLSRKTLANAASFLFRAELPSRTNSRFEPYHYARFPSKRTPPSNWIEDWTCCSIARGERRNHQYLLGTGGTTADGRAPHLPPPPEPVSHSTPNGATSAAGPLLAFSGRRQRRRGLRLPRGAAAVSATTVRHSAGSWRGVVGARALCTNSTPNTPATGTGQRSPPAPLACRLRAVCVRLG